MKSLDHPAFTAWLLDQHARRDGVGKLARFAAYDRCWPPVTNKYGVLYRHLVTQHRSDAAALDAFNSAWDEWKAAAP